MKLVKIIFVLSFTLISFLSFSQTYNIYVSDAGNFNNPPWQILKFDHNGLNPTVFINQQLNWPQDILFLDSSNTVLVSNLGSGTIAKYNASNGTFISNFASALAGPTRIKIGPDGLIYVLQWNGNGKVLRFKKDGTAIGEFTTVGVPQSIGLDWDSIGNLYVSSYTSDLVRRFDSSGNDLGIFIDSNLVGPTNIWFDKNYNLMVVDYDGTAVKRFDKSGNYLNDFMTGLEHAEGIAFFPNGNIIIGNGGSSSVKLFDSTGLFIKDFIPENSGNLLNPNAIALHENNLTSTFFQKEKISGLLFRGICNEFIISPKYQNKVNSIDCYSPTGSLIQKFEYIESGVLNFNNYAPGFYYLKFRFNNGLIHSEKIVLTN